MVEKLANIDLISTFSESQKQDFLFLSSKLLEITDKFYIVGGTVRDFLLKKPSSKDVDIEVYNITPSEFESFAKEVGALGTGKSFFVYKWKNFDLSLPRIETKISKGYKGFEVSLANEEKIASKRRDFTINSLMFEPNLGEIFDFWGGFEDLKKQKIKAVNNESFTEDSLRVLRAIRFASELEFDIDKSTFTLMDKIDLSDLVADRVSNELIKIANSTNPKIGISYLAKVLFFEKFFGLKFSSSDASRFCEFLDFAQNLGLDVSQDELFFYLLKYFLKINSLSEIHIFGKYSKTSDKETILIDKFDSKEIIKIAFDKPIKQFLGCVTFEVYLLAKKANIFKNKITLPFCATDIIEDGFVGAKISQEFERRKNSFACQILANLK